MRFGVLGGTFDPIHFGHLCLAEEAIERFGLQRVLLVLSATPPHKNAEGIMDPSIRWHLLKLACEGNPCLVPSDLELNRSGTSYTVDTLETIRSGLTVDDELFLILGMDAAAEIQTWKAYRSILDSVKVVVARRSGTDMSTLPGEIMDRLLVFDIPVLAISSSEIRSLVEKGRSIRYLVPEPVRNFILTHGIYCREASEGIRARPRKGQPEAVV